MPSVANGNFTSTSLTISLASLAINGYAMAAGVSNTAGLQRAKLVLTLPTAVTAGTNGPQIAIWAVYANDGTNYPNPPGTTAQATGKLQTASIGAVPGGSFTSGESNQFELEGNCPVEFLLQNLLGVAFPSGTATLTLYRWQDVYS